MPGYELLPRRPSTRVRPSARASWLTRQQRSASVRLVIQRYDGDDDARRRSGNAVSARSWRGSRTHLDYRRLRGSTDPGGRSRNRVVWKLDGDRLPRLADLGRHAGGDALTVRAVKGAWRRAWVDAVDQFEGRWPEPFRIVKNEGIGLISQGGRIGPTIRVEAPVYVHLVKSGGIAARVQGLRRYYALLLGDDGTSGLSRRSTTTNPRWRIAVPSGSLERVRPMARGLRIDGSSAASDDTPVCSTSTTPISLLVDGGIGLIVEEGTFSPYEVSIGPAGQ